MGDGNDVDDREQALLGKLKQVEADISTIETWLTDPNNIHAVDTGQERDRAYNSQRLQGLLDIKERCLKDLAALPVELIYKVDVGTNVIGIDIGYALIT